MKRMVYLILFLLCVQGKFWSTEFILSDSSKEIFSRTDGYNAVKFCFINNNLVVLNFCDSEILFNSEWTRFFDKEFDGDVIELSKKYGVSTSYYLDSKKEKIYFEIKDNHNVKNHFFYEFQISDEKLIKKSLTEDFFLSIEKGLSSVWQNLPFKLEDGSEIQFYKKNKNYVTGEYDRIFQAVNNGNVIFNFMENMSDYKTLTKPCINDRKNKITILCCGKDAEKGYFDFCTVFVFTIYYNAIINDIKVHCRVNSDLDSETISYLNKNDKVKIIDRSDDVSTLYGESWYWYKVEISDGTTGWVYGKYLDIE